MRERYSDFVDMLTARVPSWDIDYGRCLQLLADTFPKAHASNQQVADAMDDLMRSIEQALVDEVGFDEYCQRFARRVDKGGFSVLPEELQERYRGSSPYEKVRVFWHDDAPRRYLFRILTTLFGEVFSVRGADSVFRPLWRSFVHDLHSEETSSGAPVPAGPVAVTINDSPKLPDRWNETIVSGDLRRLSGNVSALGHYLEKLRERFIIRQDVKTVEQRSQWLEARLKELKIAQDIQGTIFNLAIQRKEHELRAKQLARDHLRADSDLADSVDLSPLRKENSRLTLEAENARLRKTVRDLAPEQTRKEAPEQQRAGEKAACEARVEILKNERQKAAKIDDQQERLLKLNAIEDALQREMDRWARLI